MRDTTANVCQFDLISDALGANRDNEFTGVAYRFAIENSYRVPNLDVFDAATRVGLSPSKWVKKTVGNYLPPPVEAIA